MSAWIEMISDEDAGPELADMLDSARTPHGTVDNVMRVHSLRPNTMKGHVTLYRAALHDDTNTIPMWLQETISSYVSILNDCPYSLANHWKNAAHLIGDTEKATKVEQALRPPFIFICANCPLGVQEQDERARNLSSRVTPRVLAASVSIRFASSSRPLYSRLGREARKRER